MFDHTIARQLGLTYHCTEPLTTPVTVNGTYLCTVGHAHHAQWHSGRLRVSEIGYDYDFLAAIDAADDAAITTHDPETEGYAQIYNNVLRARGFDAVILPARQA